MKIYTGDNPTNKIVLGKWASMSGFSIVEKEKLEFQLVRKNGMKIQNTINKEITSEEICKRRKYRFWSVNMKFFSFSPFIDFYSDRFGLSILFLEFSGIFQFFPYGRLYLKLNNSEILCCLTKFWWGIESPGFISKIFYA